MVGPSDFDRVKYNEAYMLVYSLKKPALPPPNKQPSGILVTGGNTSSDGPLNDLGSLHHQKMKQVNGGFSQTKNQGIQQMTRPVVVTEDSTKKVVLNPLLSKVSNGEQKEQANKNSSLSSIHDLNVDLPLRRTMSTPETSHPLFGKPVLSLSDLKGESGRGPCWYSNGGLFGETSLQKRKPDEASSRHSSSKMFKRPQHSGLKKLKEMKKKLKLLESFGPLRINRTTSYELPGTRNHLQSSRLFADLTKA